MSNILVNNRFNFLDFDENEDAENLENTKKSVDNKKTDSRKDSAKKPQKGEYLLCF